MIRSWGEEIARHLRLAVRLLAKSPAFALAAVLTLGLCVGANGCWWWGRWRSAPGC